MSTIALRQKLLRDMTGFTPVGKNVPVNVQENMLAILDLLDELEGSIPAPVTAPQIQYTEKILTHAQLLTASSAPTIIVPAPGANKMIGAFYGVIRTNFTSAYTGVTTDHRLVLNYRNINFTVQASNIIPRTILTDTTQNIVTFGVPTMVDPGAAWTDYTKEQYAMATGYVNSAIELTFIAGADMTGGHANNTMKIKLYHVLVDFT